MIDVFMWIVKFLVYSFFFISFLCWFVYILLCLAEKKMLTLNRVYTFMLFVSFAVGFIYNYSALNGSFLSGLEGGSISISIILILGTILLLINRKHTAKKVQ